MSENVAFISTFSFSAGYLLGSIMAIYAIISETIGLLLRKLCLSSFGLTIILCILSFVIPGLTISLAFSFS